jgi:hypothetical protein
MRGNGTISTLFFICIIREADLHHPLENYGNRCGEIALSALWDMVTKKI